MPHPLALLTGPTLPSRKATAVKMFITEVNGALKRRPGRRSGATPVEIHTRSILRDEAGQVVWCRSVDQQWRFQRLADGTWSVRHEPTRRVLDGAPSLEIARECCGSGATLRMMDDLQAQDAARESRENSRVVA